jgi:hypothetical protein
MLRNLLAHLFGVDQLASERSGCALEERVGEGEPFSIVVGQLLESTCQFRAQIEAWMIKNEKPFIERCRRIVVVARVLDPPQCAPKATAI